MGEIFLQCRSSFVLVLYNNKPFFPHTCSGETGHFGHIVQMKDVKTIISSFPISEPASLSFHPVF